MNFFSQLFPVLMAVAPDDGDWKQGLPTDVQNWDEVSNSETSEKFWEQMTNMRSRLGRSITIPGEQAGQEDWSKFNSKLLAQVPTLMPKPDTENAEQMAIVYKALGLPDSPDKYTAPEVDSQGLTMDNSMVDVFREVAHGANLSDKQFQHIVKSITEHNVANGLKDKEASEQDLAALKKDWGAAYDQNYSAVRNFLKATDAPAEIQQLAEKGHLSSTMAKWFLDQKKAVSGGSTGDLATDKALANVMTPEEARSTISEIMNNKTHAYWQQSNPGHTAAVKRMVELHKLAGAGV